MDAHAERHPSTVQACRGFAYKHLPDDPELTAGLRKLREAKDCAVLLAAIEGVRSDG